MELARFEVSENSIVTECLSRVHNPGIFVTALPLDCSALALFILNRRDLDDIISRSESPSVITPHSSNSPMRCLSAGKG